MVGLEIRPWGGRGNQIDQAAVQATAPAERPRRHSRTGSERRVAGRRRPAPAARRPRQRPRRTGRRRASTPSSADPARPSVTARPPGPAPAGGRLLGYLADVAAGPQDRARARPVAAARARTDAIQAATADSPRAAARSSLTPSGRASRAARAPRRTPPAGPSPGAMPALELNRTRSPGRGAVGFGHGADPLRPGPYGSAGAPKYKVPEARQVERVDRGRGDPDQRLAGTAPGAGCGRTAAVHRALEDRRTHRPARRRSSAGVLPGWPSPASSTPLVAPILMRPGRGPGSV